MENLNTAQTKRDKIIYIWLKGEPQNQITEIMAKPVNTRTWSEIKELQTAYLHENDYKKKKMIDAEVRKSYEYVYSNDPVCWSLFGQMINQEPKNTLPQTPTSSNDEKLVDIGLFLKNILETNNKETSIKYLQKGINIMNGYNNPLKEDGILGDITKTAFTKILHNKSPEELKKYIKIGIINDTIINNTDKFANLDEKIGSIK